MAGKLMVFALLALCVSVHGATSAAKKHKLAPGAGVTCSRSNPSSGNTCLMPNTFCGYYEECPKCVCSKENQIGVVKDGGCMEECVDTNLANGVACVSTLQCANNLVCGVNKLCICPSGYLINAAGTTCDLPFHDGTTAQPCHMSVGCQVGFYCDAADDTCKACVPTECAQCDDGTDCKKCKDNYRRQDATTCQKCTDDNCKQCDTAAGACDVCMDGYYKDSLKDYKCTKKIAYGGTCKDENDECATTGSECRAVEGVKVCTCIQGYTWNPSTTTCIHPDANVNVAVNGSCNYDMTSITEEALCGQNDKTLQICTAGLECVEDCPCVDKCVAGTSKTCATPVQYGPQHIYGPPGSKETGSVAQGKSARSVASLGAVFASLVAAVLFW